MEKGFTIDPNNNFEKQTGYPVNIAASLGVDERLKDNDNFFQFVQKAVDRYMNADFGDNAEDRAANLRDFQGNDGRILADYNDPEGKEPTIWICSEGPDAAHRFQYAIILFPEEY